MVSVVCEAFTCTPSEALTQDIHLVRHILDCRAMEAAKDQHNRDVTQLSPHQSDLWAEMVEAAEESERG